MQSRSSPLYSRYSQPELNRRRMPVAETKVKYITFNSSGHRNVPPTYNKYSSLSRKPTQADHSALYEGLKEYGRFTGLCWLISPEPPLANQLPFPTIAEIIFSEEFLQAIGHQQQLDCLVCHSRLQQADILSISEVTVGQQDNPAWFLVRRSRLTASNFGSVLKAKRITPSLLKRLLREYDLSRVKAVQWGVNNEEEAIKAFTLKTGLAVKETGIWFHSSRILGAPPDSIIDEETVLEVKVHTWNGT